MENNVTKPFNMNLHLDANM